MTAIDLERLEAAFADYVARFRDADGRLHPMQQLKWVHTRAVVADAGRIMQALQWDPSSRPLGEACAWLHDVGRFSQYAEFRSFEDRKSIDHASRGCEVVAAEQLLCDLPRSEQETVLTAVRMHNRRDLPADLPEQAAPFVHLVRDADKLDIFRVFEEAARGGDLAGHPEIAWSMDVNGKANPEILAAICAGRTVSYGWVHSLVDFVLIQVGWLRAQFHFDAALALAVDRRALEFREEFVLERDDTDAIRNCFVVTRKAVADRLVGHGLT